MAEISIKIIDRPDGETFTELNDLLVQWSATAKPLAAENFETITKESFLIGAFEGEKLIGTATLIPMRKLSGLKGSIEHVLVSEAFRGKGIGKQLMEFAIALAKEKGIDTLFLTCEPERVAANALYQTLGFTKKDTYFYQLTLNSKIL